MRDINIAGETVAIAASPWTVFVYTREFGKDADLLGDLMGFAKAADEERFYDARFIGLYKILWAMLKTAKIGGTFPAFEEWMKAIDVDLTDEALWTAVMEEAARGLFRGAAATQAQAQHTVR
jgi:hypothetical protein